MEYLFTKFGQLFLKYPNKNDADIINCFCYSLSKKEQHFFNENCELFLQLIDTVKDAPEEIKKKILNAQISVD